MRLIDADALFREMEKAQWYNNADRDEIAEELVLNAPTIEPERKKGKWVGYDGDWLKTMCKCSECGAMIDINEKYRNFFCYHCGSDMREDVLPSAQPEIVRCKECVNADENYHCDYMTTWNYGDCFCSYGKRRTDE